jgi:two-component system, sensor histidine kinase YesM
LKLSILNLRLHSIRFKIILATFAILLPLWIFFLYNNIYAIRVVHEQVANSNKTVVTLNMNIIDYRLNSISIYLAGVLSNDPNLNNMQYATDKYIRDSSKFKIFNKISNDILEYSYINSIFVYSKSYKDYFSVYSPNNTIDYDVQQKLNSYIKDLISNNPKVDEVIDQGYFPKEIDSKFYLFRIFKSGSLYIGTWVSTDYLKFPLNLVNKGVSLFVTSDGKPMNNIDFIKSNNINLMGNFNTFYLSGKKNKYLIVGQKSANENFSLVDLVPDNSILENLAYFRQIALIICIIFIFIIIIYMLFMKRGVFTPLSHILTVMKRIHDGDIDQRITYRSKSDEFSTINETFNSMMDQIQDLKISVYEEQISKHKEELEHLKLQISPHFFMNSLYIIYGLAQVKDYKLIQDMSLCLSKYFSYISRKNMTLVKLSEEIDHIKNYIRIQELRFPDCFKYSIEAPENLLEVLVPPLVIQTFVENTMKYALTMDEAIDLTIIISSQNLETGPGIQISIKNTGKWIDEAILEKLRSGKRIIDEQGEHIGIWNIKRRLDLIYSGQAKIIITNVEPEGVVFDIIIPIQL